MRTGDSAWRRREEEDGKEGRPRLSPEGQGQPVPTGYGRGLGEIGAASCLGGPPAAATRGKAPLDGHEVRREKGGEKRGAGREHRGGTKGKTKGGGRGERKKKVRFRFRYAYLYIHAYTHTYIYIHHR